MLRANEVRHNIVSWRCSLLRELNHYRICQLLDQWINLYPTDFAVSGASGALAALIKSILNKTYLLHYGAEFLPFLEMVSGLKDKDASWSLKVEDENSDSSSVSDDDHSFLMDQPSTQRSSSPPPLPVENSSPNVSSTQSGFARERKASLPLTAKALIAVPNQFSFPGQSSEPVSSYAPAHSPKAILRMLQNTSQLLHNCDPADIAQEMTRIQCQFFLRIEVRGCRHDASISLLTNSSHPLATSLAPARACSREERLGGRPDHRVQPHLQSFR